MREELQKLQLAQPKQPGRQRGSSCPAPRGSRSRRLARGGHCWSLSSCQGLFGWIWPRAASSVCASVHPLGRSGVYEHTLMLGSASLGILGPASPHRALPCLAAPWCPLQARRVPAPLRPPRPAAGGKAERGAIKGSTWRRLLPSRLAPGPVFGLLKTCLQLVSSR